MTARTERGEQPSIAGEVEGDRSMLCVGVRQECSVIVEGGGATVDSPVVSVDHPSNDHQRLAHWRGLVKSGRYVREGREELKSRH